MLGKIIKKEENLITFSHYNIKNLVYLEIFSDVRDALQREKNIKHWPRAYKVHLIVAGNPTWRDLYEEIAS